jgi:hypothetical protein
MLTSAYIHRTGRPARLGASWRRAASDFAANMWKRALRNNASHDAYADYAKNKIDQRCGPEGDVQIERENSPGNWNDEHAGESHDPFSTARAPCLPISAHPDCSVLWFWNAYEIWNGLVRTKNLHLLN